MSGAPLHSYPWYPTDWLLSKDRLRLNPTERGLYRDLLDYLYLHGEIEDDTQILTGVLACSEQCLEQCFPNIRALLKPGAKPNTLTHQRVVETLPYLHSMRFERQQRARRAADRRWSRDNDASGNAPSMLQASVEQCSSNAKSCLSSASASAINISCASSDAPDSDFALQPEAVRTPPRRSAKPDPQAQWFTEFWSGVWKKRGKAQAKKSFRRLVNSADDFRLVMAARDRDMPEMLRRDDEYRPHPSTWLNSEDWRETPGDAALSQQTPGDALKTAMATDTRPDWEGGAA